MVKRSSRLLVGAMAALLTLGSAAGVSAGGGGAGTVYTLTNAASGNAVLAFSRTAKGSLAPLATYATGGLGRGSGLGSQGAVTIPSNGEWLLAVTEHDRLVYAVHDGGAGNIAGFTINGSGDLAAIAGSSRPLSTAASAPAEIAFNPTGDTLTVSEKGTNRITTYAVGGDGRAAAPTWTSSARTTPFGFAFDAKGRAFVSEAAGGAPNASTLSSYAVGGGAATLLDGPAATTETAACWVAVTNNRRFATPRTPAAARSAGSR